MIRPIQSVWAFMHRSGAGLAPGAAALWRGRLAGLGVLIGLLSGCASLPTDVQRPVSHALAQPGATPLGQLVSQRRPEAVRPDVSGFALIASSRDAFATRLALTQQATRTLDIQYYAIHADPSAAELLRAVRTAAGRGVRVRILLDDFNSAGHNALVMRMASVPGVQMRMFNPLPGDRGLGMLRALGSLHDFQRIQHRMHNKLFIADNAWGVTGGRNLGDAYFGIASGSNFVDLDVLAAGPVVQDMSASFDRYWNNPLAYPVETLITPEELARLGATTQPDASDLPAPGNTPPPPPPMDLVALRLVWAPAVLRADSPFKLVPGHDEQSDPSVVGDMLGLMQRALNEVLIVSPYFVPGADMIEQFARMLQRGVRVLVFTNSLASTDALLAQVGYARHRKQMLHLGVELYEMRALEPARLTRAVLGSAAGGSSGRGSRASLHAKLVIVDERVISVGSMNLDQRSLLQNSEVALVIHSPELARQAAERLRAGLAVGAWRVVLTPEGRLRWLAPPGADFSDSDHEPDTSVWLRLLADLLSPLAPDEML